MCFFLPEMYKCGRGHEIVPERLSGSTAGLRINLQFCRLFGAADVFSYILHGVVQRPAVLVGREPAQGPRRPRGRTCGPPVRTRTGPTSCPQSLLARVPKFWETGFMRGRGSSRPGVSGLDGVMSEFRVLYRNSDIDVGIQSLDYLNELSKPACSMPWGRLRPWPGVQRERACVSRSRPDRVQHGAGRPHPPS